MENNNTRRTFTATSFSLLLLVLFAANTAFGQTTAARPDRGMMPGASYSVSDVENIGLTNGNVNLSIPLASLPPIAGGKLSFTLNAVYNSKLWNVTRTQNQMGTFYGCPSWVVDTPQLSDLGGWRITGGYALVIRNAHEDFDYVVPQPPPTPDCEGDVGEQSRLQDNWYRVVLIGPDGAEHELRPTDSYLPYAGTREYLRGYYKHLPSIINQPMRYYSFDGSYLWVTLNPPGSSTYWSVYLKDGTQVIQYNNGIQRIKDTNGNSIKIYSDTNGTHYQDEQTGREIRYGTDNKVWYQTVGGGWASVDITFGTTTVQGKLYRVNDWMEWGGETGGGMDCNHDTILQSELWVIREIVFPATEPTQPARRYSFTYNSDETTTASDQARWGCGMAAETYTRTVSKGMGGLNQMTTPLGATVKYSYSKDLKHSFSLFGDTDDIPRETVTQKQVIHDGITDTWGYNVYEFGACGGTVTAPDGSVSTDSCYDKDPGKAQFFGNVPGKAGLVFRSNRSNKELVERHWITTPFDGANNSATGSFANATFNPVVDAEYRSLLDSGGNPVRMSATTFQYDFNGNVTQTTEYDWFDPSLVSRDSAGVPTGVPGSAVVLRTVTNSYYNSSTSSSSGNVYAKRSLSTATPLILSAPQQTTIGPAMTQFSYDGQAYGTAPTAGNLTSQKLWDDVDNKWITSSQTYGSYGNLMSKIDPRGNITEFHYDDATHAVPNRVVVDPQNGTGTQTITTAFDYYTGLITSQTDANGNISTVSYINQLLGTVDPFGRPGITYGPTVGGPRHRVTITYKDFARKVIQASDLNTENDQLLKTQTTRDALGRVIKLEQTEDGTNYSISTLKVYEQMGKITYSSNATRGAGNSTNGWTRSTSDNVGRIVEVATFSGDAQPSASPANTITGWTGSVNMAYDAEFTTVTDQAGKIRRSKVDALGRLVRVDEPDGSNNLGSTTSPVQPTSYGYNVMGSLVSATQGVQSRSFTYDSLGRLRTAVNPESGTVTYSYDDNGNLLTKQDARSITTSFAYDAINRPTAKTYSDGTARIDYFYDTQTLPAGAPSFDRGFAKGRLIGVTYGGGNAGTYRGYDARGGVIRQYQKTDGVDYLTEASYSLNGGMKTQTYPAVPGAGDRRTVTYINDNAGRLTSLSSPATTYAPSASVSGINYSATGGLTSETYGNNLIHAINYNSRLQATEIKLGTGGAPTSVVSINYNYGSNNNNGSLQSTSYAGGGLSYTQSFGYDSINRLTTSQEGASWSQTNSYDRYGNRTIVGGALSFSGNNNRITTGGYAYDAAGNLTNDTVHSYAFDAENKISKVDNVSAYVYDGEGQRVRKLVNENLRFIYGIGGQQIAEFSGSNGALTKEYIYGASGLVATIEPTAVNANGTRYTTSDHLGSPRVVTNSAGGVASRHDYMPFGEELFNGGRTVGMGYGVADGLRQKFSSKERDNETGLDYFNARYYASLHGRFTGPDELLSSGRPESPQTWNRYAYVLNNPLAYTDPTGFYEFAAGSDEKHRKRFEEQLERAKQQLDKIKARYGAGSTEYTDAKRALDAYGAKGEKNGVIVAFGKASEGAPGDTGGFFGKDGTKSITVTIDMSQNKTDNRLLGTISHEGSHVQDRADLVDGILKAGSSESGANGAVATFNVTKGTTETRAYTVESVLAEFTYKNEQPPKSSGTTTVFSMGTFTQEYAVLGTTNIWNPSWAGADVAKVRANRAAAISKGLSEKYTKEQLNQRIMKLE